MKEENTEQNTDLTPGFTPQEHKFYQNRITLWTAATQALAMLEQYDPGTADAIRNEFKSALKGAR